MSPLQNPKHERFAQEIANGAATKVAYRLSGYKARGPACYVGGSRLLKNDKIRARVAELQVAAAQKVVSTIEVTTTRVVQELAGTAFANVLDYLSCGDDGLLKVDLAGVDRDKANGIAEVIFSKDGAIRIKLGNKQAALAKLLEYTVAMDELARQNKPNGQATPAPRGVFDVEAVMRKYGTPDPDSGRKTN